VSSSPWEAGDGEGTGHGHMKMAEIFGGSWVGLGPQLIGLAGIHYHGVRTLVGASVMSPADLRKEACNARGLARRARWMAGGLSLASDRERLNRFADETDARAASLEAEVAILTPITPKSLAR
jgi:hypothetical protein